MSTRTRAREKVLTVLKRTQARAHQRAEGCRSDGWVGESKVSAGNSRDIERVLGVQTHKRNSSSNFVRINTDYTVLQVDGTWVFYTSKETIRTDGCRAGTTFEEKEKSG